MTTRTHAARRAATLGVLAALTAACSVHTAASTPSSAPVPTASDTPGVVSGATAFGPDSGSPVTITTPAASDTAVPVLTSAPPSRLAPTPTGSPRLPLPVPAQVDQHSAVAVMTGALQASCLSDTSIDANPTATAARAARAGWYTPAYAATTENADLTANPGLPWITWVQHRAYIRCQVLIGGEDHPADTATAAIRKAELVQTPIGRDGWTGPALRSDVVVVATATTAGGKPVWRVARIS